MSDDSIKQLLGRRVGQNRTAEEQTAIDAARGAIVAGMEDQRIGRLLEAAAEASTPERVEAEAMAARSREHARVGRRPLSRAVARRAGSPRNEEGYRRMQSAMENPTDALQPRPVYEMFPHDPASQPENQDWYRQNTPPTASTRLSPVQQAQQQGERAALAEEERNMFLDIIESANQRMRQLQRRLEEAQADRPAADRARRNLRRRPEVNLLGD